jgi:hypothetical protein
MKTQLINAVRNNVPPPIAIRTIEGESATMVILDHPQICCSLTQLLDELGGLLVEASDRETLILLDDNSELHLMATP